MQRAAELGLSRALFCLFSSKVMAQERGTGPEHPAGAQSRATRSKLRSPFPQEPGN